MKYFNEAKFIWTNLVPKNGQADNLQGELLRQIEKLRYEAQDNGNVNWDQDFEFFSDFISDTLSNSGVLDSSIKEDVKSALTRIKTAGKVAQLFNEGKLSEDELEKDYNFELAYVEDDLYDIVVDAIALFYMNNPEPISYTANPRIYR